MSTAAAPSPDTHYRLASALALRILGLEVLVLALVVLVVSIVSIWLNLPMVVPVTVALFGLVVATGSSWWLRARLAVVTLGQEGYAVRLIRGAGVRSASWQEVAEVVTTNPQGIARVVLRLKDGGVTTIPVVALAGDREEFVRDLQRRLQAGHGLRHL